MKMFPLVFLGLCLTGAFWLSKADMVQTLTNDLCSSMIDLNESFETFTLLMSYVPVDGMEHSAMVMANIHISAIQMIEDICAVAASIDETTDDDDYESISYFAAREWQVIKESDKIVSYTEGLKKSLENVRDFVLTSNASESCVTLPIGPMRVYTVYQRLNTVSRPPIKDDLEELLQNVELALHAETAAVGRIADIIIKLPTRESPVWARLEAVVQNLLHHLIGSINWAFLEVKNVLIGEKHDALLDRFILEESRKIRMLAEAMKDSAYSIDHYLTNVS